jgi:hypothetical protein
LSQEELASCPVDDATAQSIERPKKYRKLIIQGRSNVIPLKLKFTKRCKGVLSMFPNHYLEPLMILHYTKKKHFSLHKTRPLLMLGDIKG